jgi:hypothetical protein
MHWLLQGTENVWKVAERASVMAVTRRRRQVCRVMQV